MADPPSCSHSLLINRSARYGLGPPNLSLLQKCIQVQLNPLGSYLINRLEVLKFLIRTNLGPNLIENSPNLYLRRSLSDVVGKECLNM